MTDELAQQQVNSFRRVLHCSVVRFCQSDGLQEKMDQMEATGAEATPVAEVKETKADIRRRQREQKSVTCEEFDE